MSDTASIAPPRKIGWGWRPSRPDFRDDEYAFKPRLRATTPSTVVLIKGYPFDPRDQGNIGSCTGFAGEALYQYVRKATRRQLWPGSPLFQYWCNREIEGNVAADTGAEMRTIFKALAKYGLCPESYWTYDDTPAAADGSWPTSAKPRRKPSSAAFTSAEKHQGLVYRSVAPNRTALTQALAAGSPVAGGLIVVDTFFDRTGRPRVVVPLPTGREMVLGGHATNICGYNLSGADVDLRQYMPGAYYEGGISKLPNEHYLLRNSWGKRVQAGGYYCIPMAYMEDPRLAGDYWILNSTEA